MHGMGAAPSPWQPPPDSDVGTSATRSVATGGRRTFQTLKVHAPLQHVNVAKGLVC